MKKPSTVYFLLATSLIAGTFLAGCADTTITATTPSPTTEVTAMATQYQTPVPTSTTSTYTSNPVATTQPTTSMTVAPGSTGGQTYKDGAYSESASYRSPAGNEDVTFAFTLQDGVIANIDMTSPTTNPRSKNFQGLFLTGIKQQIIGKKLDEIGTFDKVNGSSLTPKAFNTAITELKSQAQA